MSFEGVESFNGTTDFIDLLLSFASPTTIIREVVGVAVVIHMLERG
jgi:hypothetical protein